MFSMQSKGVQVLVVGVGSRVGNSKLQNIAMGNPQNVMMLTSFDQLAVNLRNLTKGICQGICKLILKLLRHVDVSDVLFYLFCIFSFARCGIDKSKYNVKKHQ